MRYGTVKGTQYGGQQKELVGVTWVIHEEDPSNLRLPTDWPKELQETVGATQAAIDEYHQVFLSPNKPGGVSYTYGNRLMRYPVPEGSRPWVDQVAESLVANLKKSPDSRRAVATTLVPWIDTYSDEPPCITQVQAIQSNHKLHLLVVARSHDIFKAAVPNAFGLRLLQTRIAHETGFELGVLQITSQSAHIYEGDWENANKLAACAFWQRPVQKMYDAAQADPRGIFIIRLQDKKIKIDFNSLTGEPLLQFEGVSADRLGLQIAQHELISQSGHALDIGIQLARAEIALKKGIAFTQDRPLIL
jgi:thymidylate synthase (methanogen type)